MTDHGLDDLSPNERRLLRSRPTRDAAGQTSGCLLRVADLVLTLAIGFGILVLAVWAALQVLG